MALIKCKNCGNFISTKAECCPKCGFKNVQGHNIDGENKESTLGEKKSPLQSEHRSIENNNDLFSDSTNATEKPYNIGVNSYSAREEYCDVAETVNPCRKSYILIGIFAVLLFVGIFGYLCYDRYSPIRLALQREKNRTDSLVLVSDSLRKDQEMYDEEKQRLLDQMVREDDEINKMENERIKKEHADYLKRKKEEEQEEEQRLKELNTKGPEWLDGTWSCATTYYDKFTGRVERVTARLYIDREKQTLKSILDNEVNSNGKYHISDGALYCGISYWRIDYGSHRLGFGNGDYYTKE